MRENRPRFFKRLWDAVLGTAQMMLDAACALAVAGIVVGVTAVSGLGFKIGYLLSQIGANSLIILLIAAAIGCIILGMGMPSVAAYALVAVLVGPSLVDFGVNLLAAHLFIYYFAIVSNLTPPIAFAAIT